MNILQQTALWLLTSPYLNTFLRGPATEYLTRAVGLDLVSVYTRGQTIDDILQQVAHKLDEERSLLSHARLRLCQHLVEDGVVPAQNLEILESLLETQLLSLRLQREYQINLAENVAWEPSWAPALSGSGAALLEIEKTYRQSLIPWEHDPTFFAKFPQHQGEHQALQREERVVEWHCALWYALQGEE